jgi:hypothetical protein
MTIKKSDIGRWITVKYDDVGKRDVLLVDIRKWGTNNVALLVFEPFSGLQDDVVPDMVIEKRNWQHAH